MKRFLPYILILTIVVQLFAPFTLGNNLNSKPKIEINKAEAVGGYYFLLYTSSQTNGMEQLFSSPEECNTGRNAIISSSGYIDNLSPKGTKAFTAPPSECIEKLEDRTMVDVYSYEVKNGNTLVFTSENFEDDSNRTASKKCEISRDAYVTEIGNNPQSLTVGECTAHSVQQKTSTVEETARKNNDVMPACSLNPFWSGNGTVMGCIAQAIYYVLFVPTSYVFALAGTFFDVTFHYSVQDTSYRTPFVTEGWGLVRDFCNMFFIFIMLYIAFSTILGLHGVNPKEMIVKVVIIGLLINFSLFATQVMIDASNILARVFYNSDSIKITQKGDAANGVTEATLKVGPNGEIPLSAAIVNKINPQNLIINGTSNLNIQDKGGQTKNETDTKNLSVGSFILITFLAIAVNIVGIITFLSVGLIFVARVVGLWMAMILSPFVFFTYTVPSLKDMKMVGWTKWWPETLKLAFLAPVFIFFMYLIIAFLEKGLSLVKSNQTTDGMTFIISIIIPFIFIMVLLMKAKDIAKDMSGELGQSITNGVKAIGGVALGGAALGTALLGRKVVGAGLATMSRSEGAMQRATHKVAFNKEVDDWKAKGSMGPKPKFEDYLQKNNATVKGGLFTRIGAKLNEKQMKIGEIDHARHEIDETKKTAGLEGVDDVNLSGVNEKKLKDTFIKNKQSEIESNVKKGNDGKKDISLIDNTGKILKDSKGDEIKGEESYKKTNRDRVEREYMADNKINNVNNLTDKDKKNIENQLNNEFNIVLKATVKKESDNKYEKIRHESKQKVGGVERTFSKTNTGSWDVRKLSEGKTDQREGFLTKVPVALIAGIATGVRAGMKNVGVSNGGVKVEGNFMKDLGNTISDSLKSMKVDVDLSHVGEHKSSADAHGGGDGHH